MGARYAQELFTTDVLEAQRRSSGRSWARPTGQGPEHFGPGELEFIAERDSFYLASVTSDGWPYVQHRGGPKGFLTALDASTLAFADLKGNRQLISTGNVSGNDRVSIIAVDYPHQERLKIIGHAKIVEAADDPALLARVTTSKAAQRIVVISVVAFDWNCPAYITPRYTVAEVEAAVKPLRERIAELEKRVAIKRSAGDGAP